MITSLSNQQVKNIIKCKKSSGQRKKQGIFIVEGIRMFREIPTKSLKQVFVTEKFYFKNEELFDNISFELVSESVFKEMSDTMTPQGVLAVIERMHYSLQEVTGVGSSSENNNGKGEPSLLLLENLQDPGNLGTIVRMAEGAGITGIILSKDTVDIYNPKVIRSTMGSIFRVPFVYVEDILDTVRFIKKQGITTFAAHLQGEDFYHADFTKGSCIFIGNEGNGLTPALTALAQCKIRIPMLGKVESLNAATAATILSYEMFRQRRQ